MIDVDCLGNNKFLKMLYPNGLNSNVMIKEFKVSINGFSEFSFFIKQEPNVIVKKWGIYLPIQVPKRNSEEVWAARLQSS